MTRILILGPTRMSNPMNLKGFFQHPALRERRHRIAQETSADRTGHARDPERDLQALRPSQLPLRRRPRPWAQALSLRQPIRRTAPQRLCAQRRYGSRRTVISNLHQLRQALDEICAINTELLRRHEDLG